MGSGGGAGGGVGADSVDSSVALYPIVSLLQSASAFIRSEAKTDCANYVGERERGSD